MLNIGTKKVQKLYFIKGLFQPLVFIFTPKPKAHKHTTGLREEEGTMAPGPQWILNYSRPLLNSTSFFIKYNNKKLIIIIY